jgi:cyclomaltodextrin glucanotransferase
MQTLNSYLETRSNVFTSDDWQVVFMDNHDMARISTALRSTASTFGPGNNEAGGGQSEAFAKKRVDLGLVATMTVRGIPAIYYGTEHYSANFTTNAFGQVGSDPYNREVMPSFAQDSEAFKIIQALTELRKTSPAIPQGSYSQKWLNDDILVYERKFEDDVVLVALNRGASTAINVSALSLADNYYTSLVGSDGVTVSQSAATLNLDQNEAIVLHGKTTSDNTELTNVTFTCNNGYTQWGQSVYAVGSASQLGSWAPAQAVKLDPTAYPTWQATIQVPSGESLEWKCLKRSESDSSALIEWQSGGNNTVNTSTQTQTSGSF